LAPGGAEGPTALTGLTSAQVRERAAAGQTNAAPRPGGRSVWDIIRGNVLTWFNLILGVLFVAVVVFGSWQDGLFGAIIVINAGIGIVQEMRAKITLDRLSVLTAPAAKVIRDGEEREIPVAGVVLDDLVRVTAGDQVVADGETLESHSLEVDESLLTGESVPVIKAPGDALLSGSFVVAGSGSFRATAVGPTAYAQRLTGEGKRYVRLHSELMSGINDILRVIGLGIVPVGGFLVWAQFRMGAGLEHGVTNTVAALVAMVPQGLVLLTSIAFAVSAITLARRKVLTSELPAVEGLARVDVLCIDKTGTITEPHPAFERFEPLASSDHAAPGSESSEPVPASLALSVLGFMAAAAQSRNSTLQAIGDALSPPAGWTVDGSVPFSSARKWSAVEIAGRGSWVLGAPEMVAADDRSAVDDPAGAATSPAARARAHAAALAEGGLRVLLLSHTEAPLAGETLPPGLQPVGLAVFSERVRSDASETLAYFRQQGVEIKVISGDNPATVATIAAIAGVPGAERAVDARGLPEGDELAAVMESTTVFGRVHPDQKRAMVEALQSRGHTVAMTGDGVNDVLALKKADMGIAMGTGTAAARAVSQLVLVDSRFSTLPGVVAEGRRVTANVERVAHLFTTKSVWAALLAIAVAAVTIPYPILPRHLTIIDALVIGIPGFFLALAPNPRRFIPGFIFRVARFVFPTGVLAAAIMLSAYLLLRRLGATVAETQTMETIIFCLIGWRVIAAVERPIRGWRLMLMLGMMVLLVLPFVIPWARGFFALDLPDRTVAGATAGTCVVAWLLVGLGWRIGRWLPFWREAAALAADLPADLRGVAGPSRRG
jgi:cation-transporting ATPase E